MPNIWGSWWFSDESRGFVMNLVTILSESPKGTKREKCYAFLIQTPQFVRAEENGARNVMIYGPSCHR